MSFDRLQKLGEARFTKITGDLIRGVPAMSMARTIQQEWGEFQDVAEKTLTQQLNRLRQAIEVGAFGEEKAKKLEEVATVKGRVRILDKIGSVSALETQERLIQLQMERIEHMAAKEKQMPMPIPVLNEMIMNASKINQDMQKMRFDLGLDEFKGVVPGIKAMSASITTPDGLHIHKQSYEAVETVESIFAKRGIE